MNKIKKFQIITTIVLTVLLVALLLTNGCKGKEEEANIDRVNRLLQSTTWQLNKLTVDGTDQTNLYKNMTLTVAAGTYTAQGGAPVWPASGTWKLTDESTINRDNGVTVKIEQLDETKLKLSLQWSTTTYASGRVSSISGSHVFELVRK